jgi:glycosyltransferase involved in cell wall biosynthesis
VLPDFPYKEALNMTQAAVDVLLPVFDSAGTIVDAVESLRCQTIDKARIFIIDGGSTDGTAEIVAGLARQDGRIVVLRQPNEGIIDALNSGLAYCQAEFVARQDADDVSDPTRLAVEVQYLQDHPDCVAVSGAVRHVDGERRFLRIERLAQPENADPHWAPSREPYLIHPFLMARRKDIEAIGGYRHVYGSEDTDLYWRLLERGRLHNLDVQLGEYRMHSASLSSRSIVNGRFMALSSQLAGLSALRRRSGRTDLSFPQEVMGEYRQARTLKNLWNLGRRQLDDDEAAYLQIAMAGKLLEVTAYRPYELDLDDCRFIRDARHALPRLCDRNRNELNRLFAGAAARLLLKGHLREMAALVPPHLYLSTIARAGVAVLPESTRGHVKRIFAQCRRHSCGRM